ATAPAALAGPASRSGFTHSAARPGAYLPSLSRSPGMTTTLVRKLVRDVRQPLLVLAILLLAFQCLWAKVIERLTGQLLPQLLQMGATIKITPQDIENTIFEGP